MAFSDEKFRLFWRFNSDAAEFIASSTAQGYDVDNLKRDTLDSKWRSGTTANVLVNPGFETGDFTGYTQGSAVIDNTNPATGIYSSKLVATGSNVLGPTTDPIRVDPLVVYTLSAKVDVDVLSAGTHRLLMLFYDSDEVFISSETMQSWTAVTPKYEAVAKTVGPSSASPDFNFPDGAVFVKMWVEWINTPTGTAYLDDLSLHVSELILVTFGSDKIANGNFETGDFTGWSQNSATIDITNPASGTFCSKLSIVAFSANGSESTPVFVDGLKKYRVSAKIDVHDLIVGAHELDVFFYNLDLDLIGAAAIFQWVAATAGYETKTKTIGPASSSPDIEFLPGTAFISMGNIFLGAATGTAYMDDVSIYEVQAPDAITAFALLAHNVLITDFLKLIYADDVNFTTGVGSVAITHHDDTLIEYFVGVSKQFWRLIISPLLPGVTFEAGRLLLGDHYQMERNIGLGWAGPHYMQDTSRNVRTEGGQSYSDLGTPLKEFRGEFIAHDEADLDEMESLKQTMLTGSSFIMSQNWEDYPVKRTLYGKLRSLGQPSNIAADKWTLPFSMTEQR